MTYPPQPPDPYGQRPWGQPGQPAGGYGGRHSGGYPQQPGGYPPRPYPQQPGGYPHQSGEWEQQGGWQPPGLPGAEPPEPPKRNTGKIAAIVAAVLLVIGGAVAVTGFWKPGFFLSDEQKAGEGKVQPTTQAPTGPATTEGTTAPQTGGDTTEDAAKVEEIAETVVKGLNEKDAAVVKPVSCSPENERQEQYDTFPDGITWTVDGSASVSGDKATIGLKGTSSKGSESTTLNLTKTEGTWCASSVG